MIYVDTSVILAHLLSEDRSPGDALWSQTLVSSRLTHYETWTRLHARGLGQSHGNLAREALGRLAVVELSPIVLERALEPFPVPVRALDALHLATISFLADQRQRPVLATYDARMAAAATKLGFDLHPL
jgi:predicted nucleic acid-binding protein